MAVPCLLYKHKKIIKIFGSFPGGYSLDCEWLSNVGLLDFLTPQQYGTQIDSRQQYSKVVWSHTWS